MSDFTRRRRESYLPEGPYNRPLDKSCPCGTQMRVKNVYDHWGMHYFRVEYCPSCHYDPPDTWRGRGHRLDSDGYCTPVGGGNILRRRPESSG